MDITISKRKPIQASAAIGDYQQPKYLVSKLEGLENRDFSRILYETADLMEIAGEDGFRIRSYRNGASAIEGYPERISDILANPERKITDVPGIGKGLAAVLQQIETTRQLRQAR